MQNSMKQIKLIIFIASLISTIFVIALSDENTSLLLPLIPLLFGVLYLKLVPNYQKIGAGLFFMNIILIIRYILFPVVYVMSNYNNNYLHYGSVETWSILLYIYELIAILITWRITTNFLQKRRKLIIDNSVGITKINFSNLLTIVLLLVSIYLILINPNTLSRYNFIINTNEKLVVTDIETLEKGSSRILEYTKILLTISLFTMFFNKYIKHNNKLYFYICTSVIMLLSLFYVDISRNSLLLPFPASWFLLKKYFPNNEAILNKLFGSVLLSAITLLSLMKFFGTKDLSLGLLSIDITAMYLNNYFAGIDGIIHYIMSLFYHPKLLELHF